MSSSRLVTARAPWIALLLAFASTLLKLALLACPSRHVSPNWVYPEEQHRGNIAREVLEGPLLPVQDYQHAPNVGGSVVVGLLSVPLLALLGDSIAVVRLVPIAFNALAVFVLVMLLDRFVSRRAAWIGGLLMACAPPGYSLVSITAWGTHAENNAWTLVSLYAFLALHALGSSARPERGAEARAAFAFGLVAGFALFFGYFFALALGAMLVFEFAHDKFFWARRWMRFALLGFAIGFAPWVTYNLAADFRGLTIYGAPLTERTSFANLVGDGWRRTVLLFTDLLPNSFFLEPAFPRRGHLAGSVVLLVLAALIVALAILSRARLAAACRAVVSLRHRPRDLGPEVLFLLYLSIFVIGFAATDVGQGPIASGIAHDGRYAAPLYPFLALCAACALDRIAARGPRARQAGVALTGAFVLCFAGGTAAVTDPSRAGVDFRRPGTSDEQFAQWMAWTWRTDIARVDLIVEGLETRRSPSIADGMIFTIAQGLKWGIRFQDPHDPRAREKSRANLTALRFLHDRVADAYKAYCEPPRAGEPFYNYKQRDLFWANYAHRERAARCRAALALETPRS